MVICELEGFYFWFGYDDLRVSTELLEFGFDITECTRNLSGKKNSRELVNCLY